MRAHFTLYKKKSQRGSIFRDCNCSNLKNFSSETSGQSSVTVFLSLIFSIGKVYYATDLCNYRRLCNKCMQQKAIIPQIYSTTDDYATDLCNNSLSTGNCATDLYNKRLMQQIYATADLGNSRRKPDRPSRPPVALQTALRSRSLGQQGRWGDQRLIL